MSGGDLFQVIGGSAGCRRLAEAFYAGVKHDSVLRRFFPGKSMTCAIEAFSAFLVQFLGGPSDDACRRYWVSLQESHLRFRIGRRERNAWMQQMVRALNEADIAEPARQTLRTFFEHSSAYLVNQGQAPEVSGVPQEIAPNWDRQRALDKAVAAVRRGASGDAIARAEAIQCEPSRRSGLMALMIASGDDAMLQWVEKKVRTDPTLVTARYNGRTLLHAAAAAGQTTIVRALLQLGADANAVDAGGHPPLYSVANECRQ